MVVADWDNSGGALRDLGLRALMRGQLGPDIFPVDDDTRSGTSFLTSPPPWVGRNLAAADLVFGETVSVI
eukprot:4152326-Pyramimonas_sp.AAC.1